MADVTQKPKLKNPYVDWKNKPYAVNAGSEEKCKQGERWAALNQQCPPAWRRSRVRTGQQDVKDRMPSGLPIAGEARRAWL